MGYLSKNFSRKEFACKCGCGSDNIDPLLVETLQIIRDAAGGALTVNSGVRCRKHNTAVGGVGDSQHLLGKAADITWQRPAGDLYNIIYRLFKQKKIPHLGYVKLYTRQNFVHIDVRSPKSNLVAGWM